jgi:hypothetical protein
MAGSVEALGELVDAGLVAGSLDRAGNINAAEVADAHHSCANCDTHLTGNFCTNCGQRAHVHRSLLHVGEEFLHGITHFDGKAWTTLPMLLFRPGRLTRDYIMGKRARYIAPVPLFLLVVFTMFFTFSFTGGPAGQTTPGSDAPMTQAEAVKALPGIEAELKDLDRQIAAARAKNENAPLPGLIGGRAAVVVARDRIRARARNEINNPVDLPGAIAAEIGSADKDGNLDVNLGNEALNVKARKALKNPELVLYKIQNKAYKLSFLLVPMSLPWLWLLFAWKRDVRMYDHAIFALYSISFMSLLFVAGSIALVLGVETGAFWFPLVVVAPVAHMFAQLKGAYALSNSGAAWRTLALSLFSILTLAIFATMMVIIGVID